MENVDLNGYFPTHWVEKKNGEIIGDLLVVEKKSLNKFVCRYRYSDPINLLKISECGEKNFKSGYEAVRYYLKHELNLPGDLDGWKVVN